MTKEKEKATVMTEEQYKEFLQKLEAEERREFMDDRLVERCSDVNLKP